MRRFTRKQLFAIIPQHMRAKRKERAAMKSYAVTSSSCRRGCQAAASTRQEMAQGLTDEVSAQEQQRDHITDGLLTDKTALVG